MPTFDQPVEAKLVIELANGNKLEATPERLKEFGYVHALTNYMIFNEHIAGVLREAGLLGDNEDLSDSVITPIRYIAELAFNHPQILESCANEIANTVDKDIVNIVRTLQEHYVEEDHSDFYNDSY